MEQTLEQKILGILNDDKNFTYSQLFEEDVFAPDKAVKELHKLFIQEKIDLINSIFTDGIGNLDDACSKDDLVKEYFYKIKTLTNQLNQLK